MEQISIAVVRTHAKGGALTAQGWKSFCLKHEQGKQTQPLDFQSTVVFPSNGRCHLSLVLLVWVLGKIVRYRSQKCIF